MKSTLNEVPETELKLAKMEEIAGVDTPDAETTIYDFDFWVVRDQPPYMV